ncbi:MAG: LCP family protein, partial [Bacillota bacterium]|nr:LCP family protein [Bacillota bacterium]
MKIITKKNVRVFFIWLFIFVLLFTLAGYALQKAGQVRIFSGEENLMRDMAVLVDPGSPFFEAFQDAKRVNVLVLGVNDNLTDTIMLGSYDLENNRVDVISIPRDTYYYRDGYTNAAWYKINSIWQEEGAVGTAEAVSELLLGMPIHYYAVIRDSGVEAVVDAIGGVPVDVPFHMQYSDPTDDPPLYIDIPEGQQVLDGENAVDFLRYRKGYSNGDIGRVEAQQAFIKSAFRQALSSGVVNAARVVIRNVDSDLPLGMATKIAAKAAA